MVKISGLKSTSKIPDISSIKENLSKKVDKKVKNQKSIGDDPVSKEQLSQEWYSFAEMLKTEGREREYNTMNQQVDFNEDLSIQLTIPNSFQSLTIEALQQELLTYLRTKLNNNSIQLNTVIEKIEDKKLIYTNSEKFEYLAKKYPKLKDLKAHLDLDTDF